MILARVDRQSDTAAPTLTDDLWSTLEGLAAPIGRSHWQVDVVLVSDENMAELNQQFRQREGVTDILSFSYLQAEGENGADCAAGENYAPHDLWQTLEPAEVAEQATVGELILAPNFIAERCRENDWPWIAELQMLIVHGCLHLLGWDHKEPLEMAAMQKIEANLLAAAGTNHPLRKGH